MVGASRSGIRFASHGSRCRAFGIRTTLITGAILVAYRLASGGFIGDVAAGLIATVISVANSVPMVFVMERVLFRGLIDGYLQGSTPRPDRASALYGSVLWGSAA